MILSNSAFPFFAVCTLVIPSKTSLSQVLVDTTYLMDIGQCHRTSTVGGHIRIEMVIYQQLEECVKELRSIMDKSLVVSNYNTELDWLKETYSHGFSYENTFIYDKSDREIDFNRLGWVTRVPNYSANQYDYISFIIDNYDNLPKMSYFIKGNMFSKDENYYTTRERFAQMLDSEELFSGWQDKQLLVGNYSHTNTTPLEVLQGGRLRQPIGWCSF